MYALLTPAGGPGVSPATAIPTAATTAEREASSAHRVVTGIGATSGPLAQREVKAARPAAGANVPEAEAPPTPTTVAPAAVHSSASPAQKRLNFLLQASVHVHSKSPALSRVLQQQLHEVARKHVLRLHASVKHSWCGSCFSLLLPHNATVRQFSRSGRCIEVSSHASNPQLADVRTAKRETHEPPVLTASGDSGEQHSGNNIFGCGTSSAPCRIPSASSCSNTSYYCSEFCRSDCCSCSLCCMRVSKHRRRKRRKLLSEVVDGKQIVQPPLMEVQCRVCGFKTRRP